LAFAGVSSNALFVYFLVFLVCPPGTSGKKKITLVLKGPLSPIAQEQSEKAPDERSLTSWKALLLFVNFLPSSLPMCTVHTRANRRSVTTQIAYVSVSSSDAGFS
jgi:hypothetical protein